jgi:hypothetical protein
MSVENNNAPKKSFQQIIEEMSKAPAIGSFLQACVGADTHTIWAREDDGCQIGTVVRQVGKLYTVHGLIPRRGGVVGLRILPTGKSCWGFGEELSCADEAQEVEIVGLLQNFTPIPSRAEKARKNAWGAK